MYETITGSQLVAGFQYQGQTISFVSPRGIFKPSQMQTLLSIKTVVPRPGGRVWYDDQREAHEQIYKGDELVDYAFQGNNPDSHDNRLLYDAMVNQIPVIYFLGVAPGRYKAFFPTFIAGFDRNTLKARLAFAASDVAVAAPDSVAERRYALRAIKQRLHQASFREVVISAYGRRCAISGLPEPQLLDAAHIMADQNERFGQPIVQNGITLSKIHHAAFDKHLIGIDPNKIVHVSERLLEKHDGPMLQVLKGVEGTALRPPKRDVDAPDRERLDMRFQLFEAAN